jgi:putative SOS response-associated peptidase YedK
MCGRYASTRSAPDLSARFEALDQTGGDAAGRYNLAPTDPAPLVRVSRSAGARVLSVGRWGLVPHWARDARTGARMINARAETVAGAKAYAEAFANRRALVPVDGWYEWLRDATGKQPYFMTPRDGSVLALAGLWSRWGPDGLLTFSVVTTAAAGPLAAVHDRMPLVLEPGRWDRWLARDPAGGRAAEALLAPAAPRYLAGLEIRPVGPAVGNVRNDGPELVKRVDAPAAPPPEPTLF